MRGGRGEGRPAAPVELTGQAEREAAAALVLSARARGQAGLEFSHYSKVCECAWTVKQPDVLPLYRCDVTFYMLQDERAP